MKSKLLFLLLLSLSITGVMAQTNVASGLTATTNCATIVSGTGDLLTDGIVWTNDTRWRLDMISASPDPAHAYVALDFGTAKTLTSVKVYGGYSADGISGDSQILDFKLQSWDGSLWIDIPGASVTDNMLFIIPFTFSPAVTTTQIRMDITKLLEPTTIKLYEIEAWTASGATVPDAPTGVSAVSGNQQATVSFTAPANNGGSAITGYTVTSNPGSIIQSGASSSIVVSGLTNGTAYTFTVVATNAIGNSVPSSASAPVTPAASATVPDAPTSVSAVSGDQQATVSFTAPANNGGSAITGYTVTSNPGSITQSGASSSIVVSGLTNGTAYTFTVVATNAIGNSVPSSASNSVTPEPVTSSSVNVALGKSVTVSGTTYSGDPLYLTDGILLDETNVSRWRGDVPSTVDIDFGTVQTIVSADIYTGYFSGSWESIVTAFSLQSWDGSSWIDIPGASITGNTNTHVTFTFSSSVTTQKVRLVTPLGASDFARYLEIQAWTASSSIFATTSIWNGSISSDWFEVSNWTNDPVDANVPPGAATNVGIPVVATNYPTITAVATCNNITIASGASLIDENNYLSVSGTATVNRTISDATDDKWHLFISPVQESTQASAGSCFGGAYVDGYNETTGAWDRLATDDNVTSGQGYAINYLTGIRDLVFTGTLQSSPVSYTDLSYTSSSAVDDNYGAGWHLVGNPYPCGINPALCSLPTNMNAFAYVWNGGNYITPSIGSADVIGTIASLQGFFVRTTNASNSFSLSNAAKVHGGTFFKSSNSASQMLSLSIVGNNYSDKTYVRFNPDATANFDQAFDAYKKAGLDVAPQLYSLLPDEKAAVNTLPGYINNPNVSLGLKVGAEAVYTLNVDGFDSFETSLPIRLDDLKLGTTQDLRLNPVYSFTAAPGDDENRFMLSFASVTAVDPLQKTGLKVVAEKGFIRVTHNAPASGTVYLYSVSGQLLATKKLNVGETSLHTATTGVFMVKVVTTQATFTQKLVVVQ